MHRTLRATNEGFAAGRAGEPLDTNPYTRSDLSSFWLTGHTSGAAIRKIEIEAQVTDISQRQRQRQRQRSAA
jgi:ribosome modulation factor